MEKIGKVGFLIILAIYVLSVRSDQCVQCDSKTDIRCATLEQMMLSKDCRNTSSPCFTKITEDGITIRGCLTDLSPKEIEDCNAGKNCQICSTQIGGCNFQEFPPHRLRCLRCDDIRNGTCSTNVIDRAVMCPIYKEADKCIIYKSEQKNKFVRDCLSSKSDLCTSAKMCYTCDSDGCNNLNGNALEIPNNSNLITFSTILFAISCFVAFFKI